MKKQMIETKKKNTNSEGFPQVFNQITLVFKRSIQNHHSLQGDSQILEKARAIKIENIQHVLTLPLF